jgi:hypothetical protein
VLEADMEMAAAHRLLLRCADLEANESEHVETDLPADKFMLDRLDAGNRGEVRHGHAGSRRSRCCRSPSASSTLARRASIESPVPRHVQGRLAVAYLRLWSSAAALTGTRSVKLAERWERMWRRAGAAWPKTAAAEADARICARGTSPAAARAMPPPATTACSASLATPHQRVLFHRTTTPSGTFPAEALPSPMRWMVEGWREDFRSAAAGGRDRVLCRRRRADAGQLEALTAIPPRSSVRRSGGGWLTKEQKNAFISGATSRSCCIR